MRVRGDLLASAVFLFRVPEGVSIAVILWGDMTRMLGALALPGHLTVLTVVTDAFHSPNLFLPLGYFQVSKALL